MRSLRSLCGRFRRDERGSVLPLTPDSTYHLHRSLQTWAQFPHAPVFDRLMNWPEGAYSHVATESIRRIDVLCVGEEVAAYDALAAEARREGRTVAEVVRAYIRSTGRTRG